MLRSDQRVVVQQETFGLTGKGVMLWGGQGGLKGFEGVGGEERRFSFWSHLHIGGGKPGSFSSYRRPTEKRETAEGEDD